MAPDGWKDLYRNTLAEVQSGTIPQARIDDAVRRILRVKAMAGVFNRSVPPASDAGRLAEFGSPAHRAIAREAGERTKIAVMSKDKDVDALESACRGARSGRCGE